MADAQSQLESEIAPHARFLVGPTAVGKSAVAFRLAERLGGEIISVDSMQVYRGMDIGTAKPSAAERSRVPHHLIDVADLTESFDAARFCELARQTANEIQARGRKVIFCGGTGLYFKALLEGIGEASPSDAALRRELEGIPLVELVDELKRLDPGTFDRIDRQNPRRVLRAIEVIRLTGRPFSQQRSTWIDTDQQGRTPLIGLVRAPEDLRRRIDERVEVMFRDGLVEETKELLKRGLAQNATAMQAIGYRQVVEHLRGAMTLEETIALVKTRTRQFARRQMTWFRHQLQVRWLDLVQAERVDSIVDRVIAARESTE
jgi:tRNA dimethylallyltransferase